VAVDDVHRDGYSPLHRAAWGAEARHTQTVEMLIKLGADPYRVGLKDGKTALEMAQQRGNLKTAKLLKKLMRKTTPTSPPDSVPESSSEPLIDKVLYCYNSLHFA
jgi:ankyrin repeat protein